MLLPTKLLKLVLALNVSFLLLLGFSYPHIEPGTGSYVAAQLTLAVVLAMLVLVSVLIYVNGKRTETKTLTDGQ